MLTKLDFLIPGFSKCGTTTLCALLAQHPGVYIPEIKETWFFSSQDFENKDHAEFNQHFIAASESQLLGEGSVSYSGYEHEDDVIPRLVENNPDMKLIFIARHPLKRIASSYREMHHSGVLFGLNAPYDLQDCLDTFPQMVADTLYRERLAKYLERFGEDSVLVLLLEDLEADPQGQLDRCFIHLGLETHVLEKNSRLNRGDQKLYDSWLLRKIRSNKYTGQPLSKINPPMQDKLLQPLGLRRKFKKDLVWDSGTLDRLRQEVLPDNHRFLKSIGKPESIWDF